MLLTSGQSILQLSSLELHEHNSMHVKKMINILFVCSTFIIYGMLGLFGAGSLTSGVPSKSLSTNPLSMFGKS